MSSLVVTNAQSIVMNYYPAKVHAKHKTVILHATSLVATNPRLIVEPCCRIARGLSLTHAAESTPREIHVIITPPRRNVTCYTCRVLHMDTSPDGSTVVSAAADETLRFWDMFGSPPHAKSQSKGPEYGVPGSLSTMHNLR